MDQQFLLLFFFFFLFLFRSLFRSFASSVDVFFSLKDRLFVHLFVLKWIKSSLDQQKMKTMRKKIERTKTNSNCPHANEMCLQAWCLHSWVCFYLFLVSQFFFCKHPAPYAWRCCYTMRGSLRRSDVYQQSQALSMAKYGTMDESIFFVCVCASFHCLYITIRA